MKKTAERNVRKLSEVNGDVVVKALTNKAMKPKTSFLTT